MNFCLLNIFSIKGYKIPKYSYFKILLEKFFYIKKIINLKFLNLLDMFLICKKYKNINYITSMLIFNKIRNINEIYICNNIIETECIKTDLKLIFNYTYLFLHALLHLQKFSHLNKFFYKNLFNILELKFLRRLGFFQNPYK